jgi:dTDP-4-dehydrorhamnose 3,5-epimerase
MNSTPTPSPFKVISTEFSGLVVLQPRILEDQRGTFVKTFHTGIFRELRIPFEPVEEFYSVSAKNVVRGMHFQVPPAAHAKLVYCLGGRVLDVVLDMRRNSSTFGQVSSFELDSVRRELLFIPVGFAHGFLSLENNSIMVYKTDAVYAPAHDLGIAWNSFGFQWPTNTPIVSERDRQFPAWPDFRSPF